MDVLYLLPPPWIFSAALILLCFVAGRVRDVRVRGTAVLLLANWALCSTAVTVSGDEMPTLYFLAFDWMAGCTLFLAPLGREGLARWQRVIIFLYGCECIIHGAVLYLKSSPEARYNGYYALGWLAWIQVLMVALACGRALVDRRRVHLRSLQFVPSVHASTADAAAAARARRSPH